ncbi:MAG: murein biosynthesis integral membrane protein MurJ [Patescibacteria group bacterium]|nr:murein biosynthesis integral membrane protein MurJ [Patescibacteria group bacterium]
MNRLLSKTRELIFASQTSMLSSTLIIASMMLVARAFGFLRYRVLTGVFSAQELDIFFASFRIPDLLFEILITGALTTTFIPFFVKFRNDQEKLSRHISSIINLVLIAIGFMIVVLYFALPFLAPFFMPGYDEGKIRQIVEISRILLLGQLPFLVIGNFLTGIAQSQRAFVIPALAPVIYNVGIIAATLMFYETLHLMAPVVGVVGGAVGFLLVQLPVLRHTEFRYKAILCRTREAYEFFRMAIPRIMTSIVAQIDATIDLTLTTLVGAGAYTMFYFAQHLQLLPISLIGIAFGQASLPYLTDLYQQKRIDEFRRVVFESLLNLMYLMIPVMTFMVVSRTPIIRLFYGGDMFDWNATVLTAKTLSYFALSLPFHAVYYFLTRCYYALFDSKTPFYISLVSISVNAALSVYFISVLELPVWSLAISFSIAMNINVTILFFLLVRKLKGFDWKPFFIELIKMLTAAIIAASFSFFSQRLLDGLFFDTTRTINVFLLLATNGILFVALYMSMTWLVGVKELYLLTRMVLKIKEYQRKIVEMYQGIQ